MRKTDTVQTIIPYNPKKYSEYQSLESGSILSIENTSHSVLLETHQAVWSPTPFAINLVHL